ncbi:MAG: hypothetical protein R3C03_05180 [Pirellulaceae bacterium]
MSRKVGRSRDGSIAGLLNSNAHLGRSIDYSIQREQAIAALTPEQIKKAFKSHIDPSKLIIIRAGDFK